jgi:hypothetical protein
MIDAKKLREERKKRIAARRAAAAPNVESAFNYNPLVQKPTTLGPGPKSGFHYFGPPPDAGTTYGMYTDNQGNGVIAPIPVKAVAPEVPTNPDAPVPAEEQPVLPAEEELELQPAEGVEVPPTVGPEATGDAAPVDPQAKPPEVPLADEMKGEGEEMIELPKSPATGEEMELMEPVAEEVKDTLIKSSKVMASLPKCPKCGFASVTSADLKKPFEKMCCTACGEDMKPLMTSEEAPVVAPTPVEPPPVTSQGPCVKCGKEPCACPAPAAAEPPVAPVAPAPVPQAEGVQYEVLQKVEAFADLTEADVHMTVFDEESANPYWNIDFRGAPVARVYLKDQPKPEEIRNTFTSAAYAEGVMGAIAKIGAHPVLKQIKAHLWSNEVNKADLAKSITASVEAKLAEAQKVKTTDLTNKLLANIQIVCAGMDKNFYKELATRSRKLCTCRSTMLAFVIRFRSSRPRSAQAAPSTSRPSSRRPWSILEPTPRR